MPDERPPTVKELSDQGREYQWNAQIPLKYWTRALDAIYHEGEVNYQEGNLPMAFVFLIRYSFLLLDDLPTHPEAKTPEGRRALRPLRDRLQSVIEILEVLKDDINKAHNEWVEVAKRAKASENLSARISRDARWSQPSPVRVLNLADNQELAIGLAQKEIERRRRLPGLSAKEVSRRREAGVWDAHKIQIRDMDDEELRRQMEMTRRQLDANDQANHYDTYRPPSTDYRYPSINKSSSVRYETPPPTRPIRHDTYIPIQPSRPPKEPLVPQYEAHPQPRTSIPPTDRFEERRATPPPLPGKEPLYEPLPREPSPSPSPEPSPLDDSRAVDTRRLTFAPAGYLESGKQIRAVVLPAGLRDRFMQIAEPNTRMNRETCGILCGSLVNNVYFISCLLVPKQTGTSDTCETEDEEGISTFCIESKLVTLGWIHTHPTQDCFLSSRDQHTHFGYQVLMPESIAIVCAPRHKPDWGIFRLTDPPGLEHIQYCRKGNAFHPHDIDHIYTDANHVTVGEMDFDVVDLRKKK